MKAGIKPIAIIFWPIDFQNFASQTIPPHNKIIQNVVVLYSDPKFKVKFNDNESEYKKQTQVSDKVVP